MDIYGNPTDGEQPEVDVYQQPSPVGYAQASMPNNTLTMLIGSQGGNYEQVRNDIINQSPAYVATMQAQKDRQEEIQLWRDAATVKAGQGDTPAVMEAINQINNLKFTDKPSFVDDSLTIAKAQLERIAAANGKTVEETLSLLKRHDANLSTRATLEVAIQGLNNRSGMAQFAQDVLGLTTLEDVGRLSPVVNQMLEESGFQGSRAVTITGAAENYLEVLRQIPTEERSKMVFLSRDKLVKAVGEEDTKRFLEIVNSLDFSNKELEGIFGAMDMLGVAALAKSLGKVAFKVSSNIRVARQTGNTDAVARDLVNKLSGNESILGASGKDATDASIATSLLSTEVGGLSGKIQTELADRVSKLLDNVKTTLYSGGATSEEVAATVARLERTYATDVNPNIIESRVVGNLDSKSVDIDVLYGTKDGGTFNSAQEALDYWKTRKGGTLEAVKMEGSVVDNTAAIQKLEAEIADLKVKLATPNTPLEIMPANIWLDTATMNQIKKYGPLKSQTLDEVWATVSGTSNKVLDETYRVLKENLPANTRFKVTKDNIRAFYLDANHTAYLDTADDANVFLHEAMHALTVHKLKYGIANPTTEIGKITKRFDDLRVAVANNLKTNKSKLSREVFEYATYLTKNNMEFATSAMWQIQGSPELARFLNGIKYKNTTLLSALFDTFKKLLGFGAKDTALKEFFGLSEELIAQGFKTKLPENMTELLGKTQSGRVMSQLPRVIEYAGKDAQANQLADKLAELITKREALDNPPAEQWAVRQKMNLPVFLDDLGTISVDELEKTHRAIGLSANPRLLAATSVFSGAITSMYKRIRFQRLYTDFVQESFDKLSNESKKKIDSALRKTEKLKRDMNPLELEAENIASDVEKEAYYAYRSMRNVQWYVKNNEATRQLIAEGFSDISVRLDDVAKLRGPAKTVDITALIGKRVYNVDTKKFVVVTKENAVEFQNRGLNGVEFKQGQTIDGVNGEITRVLSYNNQTIVGDIKQAVGKVDGAFSRVYEQEWWLKLKGKRTVNGEETGEDLLMAFRTADSEVNAKKYVDGFAKLKQLRTAGKVIDETLINKELGNFEKDAKSLADQFNAGKFDTVTLDYNYSRMDDAFIRDVVGTGSGDKSQGAVFWSGRSDNEIKSITNGSIQSEVLGPLESLNAEINNTSNFASINEWRRNTVQKWYNSFYDVLPTSMQDGNAEKAFFRSANELKGSILDKERVAQMLSTRDFILNQMGVLTTDEKIVRAAVSKLTSAITNSSVGQLPGMAHVGSLLRKADVPQFFKSVSSTMMLGMFNASQLVVQASGMLLAASMHPIHGIKAAYSVRPILMALASDNPAVHKRMFTLTGSKEMAMTENEYTRIAAAIRRTGLVDNINASSLSTAESGALNIFGSKNLRTFNKWQMGFFNGGEEINRVASFDIARREFIEKFPGAVWDSDEALEQIISRADDITMNMTKVTEAQYQKGLIGIPFQFLQHNIKFGANVVGGLMGKGAINRKEAFSLVAGNLILFGLPSTLEEEMGDVFNTLPPEAKQYLTQGIIGGIVSTIGETLTGDRFKLALGSRMTALDWYDDLFFGMKDLFSGEYTRMGAALTGPTGSSLKNVYEGVKVMVQFAGQEEMTGSDFLRTTSEIGSSFFSSWRNIDKAYWAAQANGMLMNRRGDPVANLSYPEIIAQAVGFQSTEAYEANALFTTKQDYMRTMKRYADDYMRLKTQARKAYIAGDIETMNIKDRQAVALLAPLVANSPGDVKVIQKMAEGNTSYDTVSREAFNKLANDMTSHKNRLLVTNPFGK